MSFSDDSPIRMPSTSSPGGGGSGPNASYDSRSPSTGNNNPPAWLNTFARGMSDEQYQDRKQSLDCTTIKVSIPAASTTTKKPGDPPHTVYILHVTSGITQWNIRRRYSDFYYIHQLLKKHVTDDILPQLPPKRYFGSNDSKFIEERRIQLEKYIKMIVSIPQSWTRIDIVQFLDNENNTLLFVWNFEKMRKMQDALGKMTMENKNQTERLTEELKVAKEEVQLLKDRLGQMEMFFLQHATGVASTKLTPTALRTLSEGGTKMDPKELLKLQEEEQEDQGSDSCSSPPHRGHDESDREILEYDPKIFTESQSAEVFSETDDQQDYKPEEVMAILKMSKVRDPPSSTSSAPPPDSVKNSAPSRTDLTIDTTDNFSPLMKKRSFIAPGKGRVSDTSSTTQSIVHPRVVAISKQIQDAVRLSNELLDDKLDIETSPESTLTKKSKENLLRVDDENLLSPNLPPLPPPAYHVSEELDEGILTDILSLYPERSSLQSSSDTTVDEPPSKTECQETRVLPDWVDKLHSRFDEIIVLLIPTPEHLNERLIVLDYVRTIIHRSLGAHVYPMGSFTTKTFLPGGDIDISAFLTADQIDSWFVRVNEAMCLSSIGNDTNATGYSLPDGSFKRVTIRNVSFINAWVKVVKGIVNNIEVDISANQIGALYAQALIDRLDDFVEKSHLFKRSIFLIKAWCKFESTKYNSYDGGIFAAREGRLSTWSIIIMIIWIFNKFGRQICHPFQVLVGFLSYFTSFDWTKYALTVHGPVSVEDLKALPMSGSGINEFYLLPLCGGYFPNEIFDQYRDRFNSTRDSSINRRKEKYLNLNRRDNATTPTTQENDDNTSVHSELSRHSDDPGGVSDFEDESGRTGSLISYSYYKRGLMNVIDPIQVKHNTTRAVDMTGYKAILDSLYNGKKALVKFCTEMKSYTTDPMRCSMTSTNSSSPSSSPSRSATSIINSTTFHDVSLIRNYFENTLTKLSEMRNPPVIQSLSSGDYGILKSSPQQIELSLKYAELIIGSVVTPEALAKLIVSILENKGPLPVGEIGKQLQEITGNENLSVVLRANYRGLKKVVEGFHEIFSVGNEHPFNPLVHLHDTYVRIRNECWYDDSRLAHLFTFTPGDLYGGTTSPRIYRGRDSGFSEISSVASHDSYERNSDNFLGLTKSRSFKDQHGSSSDRGDMKRSGSLSSAPIGIATGMLLSPNTNNTMMLASSPGGRGRNKNKNNGNNSNSAAGSLNNPLLNPSQPPNQPPRHSKQSQQQTAAAVAANQQQQQQYLQQQQQYYQQQYQQQMQYQTYLHQQQYLYSQQQMAMLQQQQSQQSPKEPTGEGAEGENIATSSSTVLEDPSDSSSNSPPAVPQQPVMNQLPGGGYMMYPMPIPIPYANKQTASNEAPNSPSQSSLSTSPNAAASNPYMHGVQGGPLPVPLGFFPQLFSPPNSSTSTSGMQNTGQSNQNPSSLSPVPGSYPSHASTSSPAMPVLIPHMMKPPPYGLYYGSPPTSGMFAQYSMSPQSVGSYMPPSSLPPSNPANSAPSAATTTPVARSGGGNVSTETPPSLPRRGQTS